MAEFVFKKRIALGSLPSEWELIKVAVDWSGLPLLLMTEGQGRRPSQSEGVEAWHRWQQTPPAALHIIRIEDDAVRTTRIEKGVGNLAHHVQPFKSGWIVSNARGGQANVYSADGDLRQTLNLGDAIEDIQTLPNGQIWVSYFDEGVYGNDELSREGLVCFDSAGDPIFRFGQYAKENHLPRIDDCYALNTTMNGEVWISYYMAFPLLLFRDMQLASKWLEFGYVGNAFAVRSEGLIYLSREPTLMLQSFDSASEPEPIMCLDDDGNPITPTSIRYLRAAARGASFIINTGTGIYSLAD
jgi:hypothetical protein